MRGFAHADINWEYSQILIWTRGKATTDNPQTAPGPPRSGHLIAAALLLAALALVVLYTNRHAFESPVALVVIAAIGVAALLLQLRLRPHVAAAQTKSARSSLGLNAIGVVAAVSAVFADVLHLGPTVMLIASLAAVVFFALGGIALLGGLRKRRSR